MSIKISHPYVYSFKETIGEGVIKISDEGYLEEYISAKKDTPEIETLIFVSNDIIHFNQIKISEHPELSHLSPDTFRFEISIDGKVWEPILKETAFRFPKGRDHAWNFSLIAAKYIKFVCYNRNALNHQYQVAIGKIQICISGIVNIKVSSQLDRLWVKENLIDTRTEYGWSSALKKEDKKEFIEIDLGSVNRVNEIRMLSKNQKETYFPTSFSISYSDDNITWHNLLEENGFFFLLGTWYRWRFYPLNIRYLRINIKENARTKEGKYISQIIELELYAEADPLEKKNLQIGLSDIPYASVLRSGIVRFALDGEVKEGVAVQANDRRLRDATTDSKGIVELASDGEDREGVVVQGNDRRLKYASEDLPGIVRFARNREEKPLYAVQSNDDRLKPATTQSKGIVELAEDGEDREGVVVQGNDRRLKKATEHSYGIVKLAKLGEDLPGVVVQANDPRLREGTTEFKGIVRLAKHGETNDDCAVQGSDPRIKPATTQSKGIVELAEDGEDREGVVVQGNDRRLKKATEHTYGIVRLCPKGEEISDAVVVGDDPRLSDARVPLPHEHNYAPKVHDFNSHSGTIKIERSMGKPFDECLPPPFDHSPIYGENTGSGSGITGKGRFHGVIGYGEKQGVLGISEKNIGIVGKSFQGMGGGFFSEKGLDLLVGSSLNISDNIDDVLFKNALDKLSLLVKGKSFFQNSIYFDQSYESCIALYMPVKEKENFLSGDVVIASIKEGNVQRCHHKKSNKVIGVVVENAAIILNADLKKEWEQKPIYDLVLVAFFGIVNVRVSAEVKKVEIGDLLMSSFQSGCAEKYEGSFEPGTIIGKALGAVNQGIKKIPVLLTF